MDENLSSRKSIRSFVRRAGRLTPAQNKAMTILLPKYGLDCRKIPADLNAVFGRRAPHIMEIGFGNGELLAAMAEARPDVDFIGIEVHEPGIGRCLIELEHRNLSNVRIICHDAVEVLQNNFSDGSLDGVNLFFPDPWPKKRHHKRRIVQDDFIALLARKIVVGGVFRAATDWADYAEHIETAVADNDLFVAAEIALKDRRQTKFEQRGKRLGHTIWEQAYRRV
jgi:tRNA (guanine-N7-)-methyltransferase